MAEHAEEPVVIRVVMDERTASAIALPAHQWLTPRQAAFTWWYFVGMSCWAFAFGVRAVFGPPPGWIEGFVVGVGLFGWAHAQTHLRVRVQASVHAPARVTLTLDRDGVRLAGVPPVQRFSRRAVSHWTEGGGCVLLHVPPILLPVDVARIPEERADALRRWLHEPPRATVERPVRGEQDLEYVRSRAVFVVWNVLRTHADPRNLVVFGASWVVAVLTGQLGLLLAVVLGWNLGLLVHLWRMSEGSGAPRVLSVDARGLHQRGPDGWFTMPWREVLGVARLPGLGWVIRVRYGDHPIGREVEGDVAGFMERIRQRLQP